LLTENSVLFLHDHIMKCYLPQQILAGGVFALYSLLCRHAKVGLIPNDTSTNEVMQHEEESAFRGKVESRARRAIKNHRSSHYLMLFTALFGACMIIGDGVITPSISG